MSSKLNIIEILAGHFETLRQPTGKILPFDIFVFYVIPLLLAIFSISVSFNLDKDLASLLVNFGSIFTALLLSVLVLVYDQESKLDQPGANGAIDSLKRRLLRELYYNVSYSVICSLLLVLLCFVDAITHGFVIPINVSSFRFPFKFDVFLITPLVVFITSNLFMSIVMIVKRMHTLLTGAKH